MYVLKLTFFVLTIDRILSMIECTSPQVFDPKADARRILQDPDRSKALLDILPFRTFAQCEKIHKEFIAINGWIPLVKDVKSYNPNETPESVAQDILFGKIMGVQVLEMVYLRKLMLPDYPTYDSEIRAAIDILIFQDTNRHAFIQTYNQNSEINMRNALEQFEGDINNFFLELHDRNRLADAEPNNEEVKELVHKLNKERKKNAWADKRGILDNLLIEKPLKFVRAALIEYFNQNRNQLRDDIAKKREDDDEDFLIVGYQTLIDFAADEYSLLAKIIYSNIPMNQAFTYRTDEEHNTKTFAICVILRNSENGAMAKINDKFIEMYKTSIREYILSCDPDALYNQLLAAIVQNSMENQYPHGK